MRYFAEQLSDALRRLQLRRALRWWREHQPPALRGWEVVRPLVWRYARQKWALGMLRKRAIQRRSAREMLRIVRRGHERASLAAWIAKWRYWKRAEAILRELVVFRRWQRGARLQRLERDLEAAVRLRRLNAMLRIWRLCTGNKLYRRALLRRAWWRLLARDPEPAAPAAASPRVLRRPLCACVEVPFGADVPAGVSMRETQRRSRNRERYVRETLPHLPRRSWGGGGASAMHSGGAAAEGGGGGGEQGTGESLRDALVRDALLLEDSDAKAEAADAEGVRQPQWMESKAARETAAGLIGRLGESFTRAGRRRVLDAARQSFEADRRDRLGATPAHRWGFAEAKNANAAPEEEAEGAGCSEHDHSAAPEEEADQAGAESADPVPSQPAPLEHSAIAAEAKAGSTGRGAESLGALPSAGATADPEALAAFRETRRGDDTARTSTAKRSRRQEHASRRLSGSAKQSTRRHGQLPQSGHRARVSVDGPRRHGQLRLSQDRFCCVESHLQRRMAAMLDEAAAAGAAWTPRTVNGQETTIQESGGRGGSKKKTRRVAPRVVVKERLWQTVRRSAGDGGAATASDAESHARAELAGWASREMHTWGEAEAKRQVQRGVVHSRGGGGGGGGVRIRMAPPVRLPGEALPAEPLPGAELIGEGMTEWVAGAV
jgi:hypothetical protein